MDRGVLHAAAGIYWHLWWSQRETQRQYERMFVQKFAIKLSDKIVDGVWYFHFDIERLDGRRGEIHWTVIVIWLPLRMLSWQLRSIGRVDSTDYAVDEHEQIHCAIQMSLPFAPVLERNSSSWSPPSVHIPSFCLLVRLAMLNENESEKIFRFFFRKI